jgi:signal peptidase II
MKRAIRLTTLIPLAMIIAGAISNVWDRVRFGAVADFLDFHYQDIHYPAFNIADCCIVLGVIALAIDGLFLDPRSPKKEV